MRRAIVVLGTTAAGLAALFSYKSHVAGAAVASTSPTTSTVTAAPMTSSNGSALAASASASPSRSKSATKSTPKPTPTKTTPTAAPPSQPPTAAATTPAPAKSSAPAGPSGTFTGSDENTQYGDVQVQLTVANGKITDANDVQQPSDSIASNAVSQLNQEVLTAQSANIQAVSGATYTSQGYIGSLQQAVNKAGI
jgi:uncharacterized protein with FMN-binding domain